MKPYADNWNEPLPGSCSRTTSKLIYTCTRAERFFFGPPRVDLIQGPAPAWLARAREVDLIGR